MMTYALSQVCSSTSGGKGIPVHASSGCLYTLISSLSHNPACLAVPPGALVDLLPQKSADVRVVPPRTRSPCGRVVLSQLPGNRQSHQSFVDVLLKDALHHLNLRLVYHRLAVLPDPVPVRDRTVWHPPLLGLPPLGLPPLAHRGSLPEVVQLDLANGRHEAEGLHVDGVHDRLQAFLVRLDHLHEGDGRVHPTAEPVRLPANDGVEASLVCICQHPLELGALLGPAPAHLLVARPLWSGPCARSRPPYRWFAQTERSCPPAWRLSDTRA